MRALLLALAFLAAGCASGPATVDVTPAPATRTPPGALNPAVTQATLARTVCRAGWAATVRTRLPTRAGWQHDHFVPLELGGAPADPANLWFVPTARARADDRWETFLHRQLCAGQLGLAQAQAKIRAEKLAPAAPPLTGGRG